MNGSPFKRIKDLNGVEFKIFLILSENHLPSRYPEAKKENFARILSASDPSQGVLNGKFAGTIKDPRSSLDKIGWFG